MMKEPEIIINGIRLTEAQAMTVRVALGMFCMSMSNDDALGSDATARAIRNGYTYAIVGINKAIEKGYDD